VSSYLNSQNGKDQDFDFSSSFLVISTDLFLNNPEVAQALTHCTAIYISNFVRVYFLSRCDRLLN
jgi:hypothetical protein